VETAGQRDEISAIGCDNSQGYFYARPMPASTFGRCLGARPHGQLRLPKQRPNDPATAVVADAV
jgi:predicted signal transduction protein with EAL and GGDEF domain